MTAGKDRSPGASDSVPGRRYPGFIIYLKGGIVGWKFKEDAEAQGSSAGFWYDVTDGGYINPAEVLADEDQIAKVNAAVKTLKSFEQALEANGLIQEF
jgi:hypothetical protein